LRDEEEAYANKLREATVDVTCVRFQGNIHDFVMLNVLSDTEAKKGVMDLAINWIKK
jgi:acetyl esterase